MCLFVYLCTWVSENWRYCSVTSSDSVTPRRFSRTPTTRCCLGCGPTAPPTCRGTGTHLANPFPASQFIQTGGQKSASCHNDRQTQVTEQHIQRRLTTQLSAWECWSNSSLTRFEPAVAGPASSPRLCMLNSYSSHLSCLPFITHPSPLSVFLFMFILSFSRHHPPSSMCSQEGRSVMQVCSSCHEVCLQTERYPFLDLAQLELWS